MTTGAPSVQSFILRFRLTALPAIGARVLIRGMQAMANVVVVGAQWGDEGKGKIVDWLSERADVIARFQGGHNAGHTLVIDGKVYKLNALPSGVVRGGKLSVIGNGVVLDPWHLTEEIARIRQDGVEITPEVSVHDDTGAQLYRGRIDDRFGQLGSRRPEANHQDLRDALDAILTGGLPVVPGFWPS